MEDEMDSKEFPQKSLSSVNRKPYVKPQLEKVQLVLEEAVLGTGCKLPENLGPTLAGCYDSLGGVCEAHTS